MKLPKRRPVVLGTLVTAVATAVFFVGPALVPAGLLNRVLFDLTGAVGSGNPISGLRFLGGIPGALLAGYLTKNEFGNNDWDSAYRTGLFVTMLGLVVAYLVLVVYNMASATLVDGMFPPPFYVAVVVPFLFALPLIPVYLVEGLVAGAAGNAIRIAVEDR